MADQAQSPNWERWVGPCAHGRDPWPRCDTCCEAGELQALVWVWEASQDEAKRERERADLAEERLERARSERDELREVFDARHADYLRRCQDFNDALAVGDRLAAVGRTLAEDREQLRAALEARVVGFTDRQSWCDLCATIVDRTPGDREGHPHKSTCLLARVGAEVSP